MNINFGVFGSVLNPFPNQNPPSSNSLLNGLLAWWKFSEGSGTIAYDSSGNGFGGTLTNSPIWTTGYSGSNCLAFTGSSNMYVNITGSTSYVDNLPNFSVSAWFNSLGIGAFATNGAVIAGKINAGGTGIQSGPGWAVFMGNTGVGETNGNIGGIILTNGSNYTGSFTNANYSGSGWNHVVFSVANSVTPTLYVNKSNSNQSGITGGTIGSYSSTSNIEIGSAQASQNQGWNGLIDDVRIWNRVITPTEISILYTNGPS